MEVTPGIWRYVVFAVVLSDRAPLLPRSHCSAPLGPSSYIFSHPAVGLTSRFKERVDGCACAVVDVTVVVVAVAELVMVIGAMTWLVLVAATAAVDPCPLALSGKCKIGAV